MKKDLKKCLSLDFYTHTYVCIYILYRLSQWLSGKESTCPCLPVQEAQVHPWVGTIPWKRKWQSTSVFLPGKSHGQRSLLGYSPWGCKKIRHDLGLNNNIYTYIQIICVMLQGKWDLSSPPEIKLLPPALEVCRYNHWTARKVPSFIF